MIDQLEAWAAQYPVVSLETDWRKRIGNIGRADAAAGSALSGGGRRLLCTIRRRIRRAAESRAANALLLKVNQVGTLTEAAEAAGWRGARGWQVTVSARSGETEDDWLAELAVGWGGDQIKVGSITQSERLSKYNRLLAIEAATGWPLRAWPAKTADAPR
jgi:enolase